MPGTPTAFQLLMDNGFIADLSIKELFGPGSGIVRVPDTKTGKIVMVYSNNDVIVHLQGVEEVSMDS
jgi:hypothetical protein